MPSTVPMKDDTKVIVDSLSQICGIDPAEFVDNAIRFYIAKKFTGKASKPEKDQDLVNALKILISSKAKQLSKLDNPRGNKSSKDGKVYSFLEHAEWFLKRGSNKNLLMVHDEIADYFKLPRYGKQTT